MATITSIGIISRSGFRNAKRMQQAITSPVERKVLAWLAERTPASISPDHLTAIGFAAQILACRSLRVSRWNKHFLLLATFFIAVNWLGDSLDGTLARYRNRLRPRYGFYVDHMGRYIRWSFLMSGFSAFRISPLADCRRNAGYFSGAIG